jgi:hypothetical protein
LEAILTTAGRTIILTTIMRRLRTVTRTMGTDQTDTDQTVIRITLTAMSGTVIETMVTPARLVVQTTRVDPSVTEPSTPTGGDLGTETKPTALPILYLLTC